MSLNRLIIQNFRNIESMTLTPSAEFNLLLGSNGSGKSSILEAIYTLGHGRSFRHLQASRIINHNCTAFTLHGQVSSGEREYTLGLRKNQQGDTKIRINGSDKKKVAILAQLLPIQLITPEGFTLLTGGPKFRRAFLDWGCFHQIPNFFSVWSALKKVLKQRNAALRQASHYAQIEIWDKILIPLAEQISYWRAGYCDEIAANISATCAQFLPEYTLTFSFQRGWDKNSHYGTCLQRNFERDKMVAHTTAGPHKANFLIKTETIPVEDRLSRGQLKLLMCALRLTQGEFMTQQNGQRCIYLLDDFASELDMRHRHLLINRLKKTQAQVFLSAVNQEQLTDIIHDKATLFHVEHGRIKIHASDKKISEEC